ncbi:MAG: M28 family peptidase [Gemmatimonadaceae bacterium]
MAAPARLTPLLRSLILLALVAALVFRAGHPPAPVAATASATVFSAERAKVHVKAIAQRPHPIGSADAARVRDYVLTQLASIHVPAEVQEATGVGTRYQAVGRVHNIVARLPGTHPGGPAVLLMAHTDGVPAGPAAGDDGSGTSVLLETLRALRSGPPLTHDVIALFTDGEEEGLLGAAAFVREHRWAKDVAVTLNFDARGTTGRVFMFETGPGNLDLVRIFRGAPDAFGTSLMVTVYRTLPNDTDLSEVALLGQPALNFAFGDGVERYHTSQDNVAELNPGTIQHEGAQALAITRALANGALPRPVTGDAVFFDFPLLGVVFYPEGAARPLAIVGAILVVIALISLRRRESHWIRDLILGVLATIVATALGGGAALLAGMEMTRVHASLGGTPGFSALYAVAIALLALTVAAACWALVRRWGSAAGTHAGALIVWAILTLYVSWKFPGASFLFVWPLIAASIASPSAARTDAGASISLWIATFIAMALLVPVIYSIGLILLGLTTGGSVIMGVLIPLLAWVIVPQFDAIAGNRRWRATLGLLAATILLFVVGAATVRNTVDHPVPSLLVYAEDADASDAWLVAPAELARPRSWSASALGTTAQIITPSKVPAAGSPPAWLDRVFGRELRTMVRSVPRIALAAPTATVIADSTTAKGRRLSLRIVSAPLTQEVEMRAAEGVVLAAAIDGRTIDTTRYRRPTPKWAMSYAAPPDSGFVLELTMPSGGKLELELTSESAWTAPIAGVSIPPRPQNVVPVQGGDQTMDYRRLTF